MNYEWDENKQVSNVKKHGVAFTDILSVFTDPRAVTAIDDRHDYGENRHNIIGAVCGLVFCVAFTYRNDNIRIISARLAHKKERTSYEC